MHTQATLERARLRVAIGWMLLSSLAFASMWGVIRLVSETGVHPFVTVFYRNFIGLLVIMPLVIQLRAQVFKTAKIGLHARRATSGLIATLATFYAIANAPMTTVLAINYSVPLFATLAAVFFLAERIRMRRMLTLLVGFIGVLIVLRPGSVALTPGVMAALLAAIATGFSIITIKQLTKTEDSRVVTIFSFLFMLPPSLLLALPYWVWPSASQLGLLVAVGVLASIGQLAMTRAFAGAEASAVLPYDALRLVVIVAIATLGFHDHLDALAILGGVIILGSTIYLAHRETVVPRSVKPSRSVREE
jgi:drug/metabolite transporter (DMT)-like permease